MSMHEKIEYFNEMVDHAYDYAEMKVNAGTPLVGIMCEYTPREIINAAGALTACLCGGSYEMVAPAETTLPSNLCPLIKSTFGYHITGGNPFLEWASMVIAETTCDGKKKMYEIMAEKREMYVLELPQKVNAPEALEHWVLELQKLRKHLEKKFGVEITEEKLREAIRMNNRERALRKSLAELMKRDTPPLSGSELLELKSIISCIPEDLKQYEKILEEAQSIPDTPRHGKGNVRILVTGVPTPHGAERVIKLIESLNATVIVLENCSGIKPVYNNIDPNAADPLRAIAEHYFHIPCSVMTPNTRREDLLKTLIEEYRIEAVVDLTWQACLTYDVESKKIKDLVENTLELPYLKVVTDYSPNDNERIKVRLEALIEMAQERRG